MDLKGQAFLKALLASSGRASELLHFLPPELVAAVQALSAIAAPRAPAFQAFSVAAIHYSWFAACVKPYPQEMQRLLLGCLGESQARAAGKMVSLTEPAVKLSGWLSPFFLYMLHQELEQEPIIPQEFLAEGPLNALLRLSRKQLMKIIDLLGLYDLAADMRQIINKELLYKIQKALSEQDRQFLSYCSRQPMRWIPPKLPFASWDGSARQLNHWLHHRGLIRCAKAIVRESESFKWHLLHRLDRGRAQVMRKEFYQSQIDSLIPYFKNQLLHIAAKAGS